VLYNLTNLDRDDSEVVKTTQSPARWAARLVLVGSHVTLQGLDPVGLGESFYLDIVDMGDRALRALGQPAQVYTEWWEGMDVLEWLDRGRRFR
jgi:hypothetical protein